MGKQSILDRISELEYQGDGSCSDSGQVSWKKKGRPRVWPFYDMKVGERTTVSSQLDHQKARVSACQASRRTGAKFKSRTRDDGVLVFERVE